MCERTTEPKQKSHHRVWRREAKKFRRKRIRQKLARERDKKRDEEQAKLHLDPIYQSWLQDQDDLEKHREEVERRLHDEQEELWMRRELLAQKKFREERKRQEAAEQIKEKERQLIQKEFEKQQKQIQERIAEKKRIAEEKRRKHELLLQKIDEFVNGDGELPQELYETADTNPGKEICPFFLKTATCRFGDKCTRNHSRPGVSRVLLLPNFFTHIRLEQPGSSEYGSDLSLEFSESELYQSFEEFFDDVTAELRKFGSIVNFRTCKNVQAHLRGNVFVEFEDERSSLRAYQQLQGRYYAGRRINVEFCKLVSWKAAICGLSLSRKCPKGANCNYLHIFRNPGYKYNNREYRDRSTARRKEDNGSRTCTQTASWNDDGASHRRHWRWSESPEYETCRRPSHSPRRSQSRRNSEERSQSIRSNRRSRSRTPKRCRRSRSRSKSKRSSRSKSPRKSGKGELTRGSCERSQKSRKRQQRSCSKSPGENSSSDSYKPRDKDHKRKSRTRSKSKEKEKKKRRKHRKRSKSKNRNN